MRQDACSLVSAELSKRAPAERVRFLRELLAHTAAGLVVLEGSEHAAEDVYKLADAVVSREAR